MAPGWFDGEIRDSWPAFNSERYLSPNATGHGTPEERDALLTEAEVIFATWPYPHNIRARVPKLKWFNQQPAGASNLLESDLWGSDIIVTTSRGYGNTLPIAEFAISGLLISQNHWAMPKVNARHYKLIKLVTGHYYLKGKQRCYRRRWYWLPCRQAGCWPGFTRSWYSTQSRRRFTQRVC